MSRVTMKLEGVDALKAAISRCPDQVRSHMAGVIQLTAFGVAQRAKALAPVDTGALKQSITYTARGLSGRVGITATALFTAKREAGKGWTVGGTARRPDVYWRFVEFGTATTPARPLFRAAAEAESIDFEQRIRGIVPRIERDLSKGRVA